jgi:hypothetical protein
VVFAIENVSGHSFDEHRLVDQATQQSMMDCTQRLSDRLMKQ